MNELWFVCSQVAGRDTRGGSGETGLREPPSEPQAAGAVPEETVLAAQHPGRGPAGGGRVSEPV